MSQTLSANRLRQVNNNLTTKFQGKYKQVNLENSDTSSNMSLSRSNSVSKYKLNMSWNRMPDMIELSRGLEAKAFRDKLKRSNSRRDASIENSRPIVLLDIQSENKPQSKLQRAISESNMLIQTSNKYTPMQYEPKMIQSTQNKPKSIQKYRGLLNMSLTSPLSRQVYQVSLSHPLTKLTSASARKTVCVKYKASKFPQRSISAVPTQKSQPQVHN